MPEETISNLMMCIDQGIKLMSVNALPGMLLSLGLFSKTENIQHYDPVILICFFRDRRSS